MIIEIHESIFTSKVSKDFIMHWQRFISCVVRTAELGHHFIVINPEMIETIRSLTSISEHSTFILLKIAKRSLYNYDELQSNKSLSFSLFEKPKSVNILTTPPLEIDKLLQPTEIILEDIGDNVIYNQILKSYIQHLNITAHFHYYPLNGGGDGSFRLVTLQHKHNKNIHAIFDTDKKHPDDNIGKTARQLIQAFSALGLDNNYHTLDCHEVENLHPLQSLKNKADKSQILTVLFLEHALKLKEDAYKFFDLKKSHKFCDIFSSDTSLAKYWRGIYDSCQIEGLDFNSFKEDESKHKHTLTPQLSTVVGLLKEDIANGEYNHIKISEINPPLLQETWKSIGQSMLKWTISAPQIIL